MAFLQGVKGVLPSEHRPRPGSLGFIAQAEEQAGPPGQLPAGRGGIWASHAVPAALRVSTPGASAPAGRSPSSVQRRSVSAPALGFAAPRGRRAVGPHASASSRRGAAHPGRGRCPRLPPAQAPRRPPSPRGPAASFHTSFPSRPGRARPRVLCRVHLCAPCPPPFFHWARCPVSGCVLPTAQNDAGRGPRRQPARSPIRAAPLVSRGHTSSFTRTG